MSSEELLPVVLACLRDVLFEDADRDPDGPLLGAGVDSVVLVELVAACEQASGTTLAPDLFVPATFASPRAIAHALAVAGPTEGVRP